jgi:hypothetical protein
MKKKEVHPSSAESVARVEAFLHKLRSEQWDELHEEAAKLGDDEFSISVSSDR